MDKELDSVVMIMYPIDNDKTPICYYLVSLAILRLFPLNYLNEIFPFGIAPNSFLTGNEIKSMLDSIQTKKVFGNPDPISMSMVDMYDSDVQSLNSISPEDLFERVLFERYEELPEEVIHDCVARKGVAMHNELELFEYLGTYFQQVIEKDDKSFESDISNIDHKEFLFLREDLDLYIIPTPSTTSTPTTIKKGIVIHSTPTTTDTIQVVQDLQSILIQHKDIMWKVEQDGKIGSIIQILEQIGVNEKTEWNFKDIVNGKKSILSYAIIPISSDLSQKENEQTNDEEDVIVEKNNVNVVTQVEQKSSTSLEISMKSRQPFSVCWWQQMPMILNEAEIGNVNVEGKRKLHEKNLCVGKLFMRRTWNVEFSAL